MSGWQVAQSDAADAHAFQAGDIQADCFAHATDLALLAFAQHKAQLVVALARDSGGLERDAVQAQAMIEQGESPVVEFAFSADVILLLDGRVLADQQFGNASVLGKNQQAGGVDIEPAGGGRDLSDARVQSA